MVIDFDDNELTATPSLQLPSFPGCHSQDEVYRGQDYFDYSVCLDLSTFVFRTEPFFFFKSVIMWNTFTFVGNKFLHF